MSNQADSDEPSASADAIDVQRSQGLISRPTGPIRQHFGEQTNIDTDGGHVINSGGDVALRVGKAMNSNRLSCDSWLPRGTWSQPYLDLLRSA
jgi:hypothetical protein